MKKVILIPDSFKGTLDSGRICALMEERIHAHFPQCTVCAIPVADGGEGSVDAFLAAAGGEKIYIEAEGPFFEPIQAFFGILDGGGTAVVEMAACAGLPLVEGKMDPKTTTTYGVGRLILAAAERGVSRIIVGLGGSCTNDAGCGAAVACGVRFYNGAGKLFVPTGGTLKDIAHIDKTGRHPVLEGVEIIAMCDIDNPMYGENGAAYIFGPQKGADPAMAAELDRGLRHAATVMERDLGFSAAERPGSGAAGAMGAGMVAFFDARLQMGIEAILDAVGFDEMIRDADMIFTGEGKLDSQSLRGKVVAGVARRARRQNKSVVAVVGGAGENMGPIYETGVSAVFTINRLPQDLSISRHYAQENLAFTMDNILRFLHIKQ